MTRRYTCIKIEVADDNVRIDLRGPKGYRGLALSRRDMMSCLGCVEDLNVAAEAVGFARPINTAASISQLVAESVWNEEVTP